MLEEKKKEKRSEERECLLSTRERKKERKKGKMKSGKAAVSLAVALGLALLAAVGLLREESLGEREAPNCGTITATSITVATRNVAGAITVNANGLELCDSGYCQLLSTVGCVNFRRGSTNYFAPSPRLSPNGPFMLCGCSNNAWRGALLKVQGKDVALRWVTLGENARAKVEGEYAKQCARYTLNANKFLFAGYGTIAGPISACK